MLIQARAVRKPRRRYYCAGCNRPLNGPHAYLYGYAEVGDRREGFRCCAACLDRGRHGDTAAETERYACVLAQLRTWEEASHDR